MIALSCVEYFERSGLDYLAMPYATLANMPRDTVYAIPILFWDGFNLYRMSQAWSQHDILLELNYPIKLKEKRKENIKVKGELNG